MAKRSRRFSSALVIWVTVALALPTGALAHSWYPRLCCNDLDCMVVTKLVRQADGSILMEAGHISVIVPKGFLIEPSQDHDSHVCVYRDVRGRYHPRCVFMPAEA